jgi:hypothetical protein
MSRYPIPEAVLARHIACVGETGSGKTYDTKSIVEHLVAEGHRVCVLDTIKSDWWGMISSASGKKGGLPFRIIGGPRGHVPLHAGAGKALGELVAKGKLPLSIIDMADFGPGDPQRFFEAFAQAIWKNIKGVLYLVIEEAHEIAPKERAGFGKENMSVYWAKRLATGSRTKGIRLIVATQRVQALHNAVLGSCGTLAAHSLSFPADQKPVIDWLNNNIKDKAIRGLINEEMASLPAGHAWVACPKEGFIEKVHFPAIKTFDNTATPDKDAADIHVATAAVDPEELRTIIGDAVKEAEENDPGLLKRRLVTLEAELAKLRKSPGRPGTSHAPTGAKLQEASAAGYERGKQDAARLYFPRGFQEGFEKAKELIWDAVCELQNRVGDEYRKKTFKMPKPVIPSDLSPIAFPAAPAPIMASRPVPRPDGAPLAFGRVTVEPGVLDAPLQRIVDAIRYWNVFGIAAPTHQQVAFIANYVAGSGTWNRYLSSLRSGGYLEPRGVLQLTDSGENLRAMVLAKIDAPLAKILAPLLDVYPEGRSHEDLAATASYVAGSGTWNRYLSSLRSLDLIEPRGELKAQGWLFP